MSIAQSEREVEGRTAAIRITGWPDFQRLNVQLSVLLEIVR